MYAIRGVYAGKQVKILPSEPLPRVNQEVAVAILFWDSPRPEEPVIRSQDDSATLLETATLRAECGPRGTRCPPWT